MSVAIRDLSTSYLGLKLHSPVVVGSCGYTGAVESIKRCYDVGAAAVVLKSVFEEQIVEQVEAFETQAGDQFWHPEAAEYIKAYGVENAVSNYLDLVSRAKASVKIPVIASVHCVTAGVWTGFAKRLEEAGADAIELNIFALPSQFDLTGRSYEQLYLDVVDKVKNEVGIPVALKVGFYFSGMANVMKQFADAGADGLVLFNRFVRPDFDIERLEVTMADPSSSPSEMSLPLRWIALLHKRINCDLAATTGVYEGSDLVKQLLAGAQVVQLSSALYKRGFDVIPQMHEFLIDWMGRHGFERINQFRGRLSAAESGQNEALERVQFMQLSTGNWSRD